MRERRALRLAEDAAEAIAARRLRRARSLLDELEALDRDAALLVSLRAAFAGAAAARRRTTARAAVGALFAASLAAGYLAARAGIAGVPKAAPAAWISTRTAWTAGAEAVATRFLGPPAPAPMPSAPELPAPTIPVAPIIGPAVTTLEAPLAPTPYQDPLVADGAGGRADGTRDGASTESEPGAREAATVTAPDDAAKSIAESPRVAEAPRATRTAPWTGRAALDGGIGRLSTDAPQPIAPPHAPAPPSPDAPRREPPADGAEVPLAEPAPLTAQHRTTDGDARVSEQRAGSPAGAGASPASRASGGGGAPPSPARETAAVMAALERYRLAYERLDVALAREVWPGVDGAALERAFAGLAAQRLRFRDCRVEVAGDAADAECDGEASYVPKVGGGEPRTSERHWRFRLRQRAEGWRIESATVRPE